MQFHQSYSYEDFLEGFRPTSTGGFELRGLDRSYQLNQDEIATVKGQKKIRNDRLIAVAEANHRYANVKKLEDLPRKWVKELEDFFVNYHDLKGKNYRLLGCEGVDTGLRLIKDARKAG